MTTKEHIDLIVERRYNGYRGSKMILIKRMHAFIRNGMGDEMFLNYLKEAEKRIPIIPKYEIPQSVKDALNAL